MTTADTRILAGEQRMLINGEPQLTDGGTLFDVEHPGNGELVAQATDATIADMDGDGEEMNGGHRCAAAASSRTRSQGGAIIVGFRNLT